VTIQDIIKGLENGSLIDEKLETDFYENRFCLLCQAKVMGIKQFFIHLIMVHEADPKSEIKHKYGDGLGHTE
jgi:hypothetical protein